MSRYSGLFTYDEDTHKYIPIALAKDILDQDLQILREIKGGEK